MTKQSLTDAKRMGGIIAQDGFDYQVWNALIMLPTWLRSSNFEGLIFEGMEDYEARFFSPLAPHRRVLDRFQAKSATLSIGEITEVIEGFEAFSNEHPDTVRSHTLVTPGLPAKQAWLSRDTGRVKRARPFYAPFRSVRDAVEGNLRTSLTEQFGDGTGGFFVDHVDVALMVVPDRQNAEVAFGAALRAAFPEHDFGHQKVIRAFAALVDVAAKERGRMIGWQGLLDLVEGALGTVLIDRKVLPVFVRSDREAPDQTADVELDASAFSGGDKGFPPDVEWQSGLIEPLHHIAEFAHASGRQTIALHGNYRLTTAMALGWSFRSAQGFELSIPTKDGPWFTNDHPPFISTLPWTVAGPSAIEGDELSIVVSVLRDALPGALAHLGLERPDTTLALHLPQAIATAREAQESVRLIKSAVDDAIHQHGPKRLRLYFVGPAALAVALGHRWNALPPTQLHEFVQPTGYQSTLMLP